MDRFEDVKSKIIEKYRQTYPDLQQLDKTFEEAERNSVKRILLLSAIDSINDDVIKNIIYQEALQNLLNNIRRKNIEINSIYKKLMTYCGSRNEPSYVFDEQTQTFNVNLISNKCHEKLQAVEKLIELLKNKYDEITGGSIKLNIYEIGNTRQQIDEEYESMIFGIQVNLDKFEPWWQNKKVMYSSVVIISVIILLLLVILIIYLIYVINPTFAQSHYPGWILNP